MSLLAGIKFIPKEQRSDRREKQSDRKHSSKHKHHKRRHNSSHSSASDSDSGSDDEVLKRKKKHDRRKRERSDSDDSSDGSRHHHSRKKNHADSKRRHDSLSGQKSDNDEEDPLLVMQKYADEQSRGHERSSATNLGPATSTNNEIPSVSTSKPKEFDTSKFRSLLAGLTGNVPTANTDTAKELQPNDAVSAEASSSSHVPALKYSGDHDSSTNFTTNNDDSIPNSAPIEVSNRNIAALLRQRLQQGKQISDMQLPHLSSKPSTADAEDNKQDLHLAFQRKQLLHRVSTEKQGNSKKASADSASSQANLTIQQLMQQEKFADDADMDRVFAKNVLRLGGKYAGSDFHSDRAGMDEENLVDMKMYQKKAKPVTDVHSQMKQEFRQIKQQQEKLRRALDSCRICQSLQVAQPSSSSSYISALELYRGEYFLLRLKTGNYRLTPFHCELIPLEHTPSLLLYPNQSSSSASSSSSSSSSANRIDETTEAIWKEMKMIVATIRRMMAKSDHDIGKKEEEENQQVIVMESAVHQGAHDMHVHTVIDIVPVPNSLVDEIKMSFQSAFNDAASDWTQHRAQIALTKQKPLYIAIPKHFPYYWIEFQESDGIVHPIDQQSSEFDGNHSSDKRGGGMDDDLDTSMPGRSHVFRGGNSNRQKSGGNSSGFFCYDVLAVALEEDEARWRKSRPPEQISEATRIARDFKRRWEAVQEWSSARTSTATTRNSVSDRK